MATNTGSEPVALPNCALPGIMVSEILLRLPVKSILRFRAVCKPWCEFLTSPDFARMYLHHQLDRRPSAHYLLVDDDRHNDRRSVTCLSPPPTSNPSEEKEVLYSLSKTSVPFHFPLGSDYKKDFRIDGSLNGLVCLSINHTVNLNSFRKIVIWNPATRKYRFLKVPEAGSFEVADPTDSLLKGTTLCGGVPTYVAFGFDPKANDYKIVRVWLMPGFANQPNSFWVWVYAFSTGSWKLIDTNFKYALRTQTPAMVNANMHWIEHTEDGMTIVVFEVGNEAFRTMAVPGNCPDSIARQLVCINGCLSLVSSDECGGDVDVWMMNDYANQGSWSKCYTVRNTTESLLFLVGGWKYHMLLFYLYYPEQLVSYDVFSGKFEYLQTHEPRKASATKYMKPNVATYFESLESVYGQNQSVPELQTNESLDKKKSSGRKAEGSTGKEQKDDFMSSGFKLKL